MIFDGKIIPSGLTFWQPKIQVIGQEDGVVQQGGGEGGDEAKAVDISL